MALILDQFKRTIFGNKRIVMCDCDFDSSYPTGGESLTAASLGIKTIELLIAEPKSGYVFSYDYTDAKLMVYYADYAAAAAGALIQIPDLTDLSAITNVKIFAIGTGLV